MTANKFATMLHRRTHRMAFLLIYTVLEWILIIFLLLNAVFSYMISKFATFFGLHPPCIYCSRIDYLFESREGRSSCRDFLCASHAGEVSKLGYCTNHRRLADAGYMCEDCAASKPGEVNRDSFHLSWMKRSEQGEKDLRCSCCGVALESGFYSPYLPLKSGSRDVLEHVEKVKVDNREGFELEEAVGKVKTEDDGEKEDEPKVEFLLHSPHLASEDVSLKVLSIGTKKITDMERFIPIDIIDSSTLSNSQPIEKEKSMAEPGTEMDAIENITEKLSNDSSTGEKSMAPPVEGIEEQQPSEEDVKGNDESNCEISIGSEICDQEQIEQTQFHELVNESLLNDFIETTTKEPVTESEPLEQSSRRVKHLKICPIINEIEDERMMPETPKTPNYIDLFPILPKRYLLERRESGTESMDGSITGDLDSLEPPTVDRLKAALKSERKALIAVYAELEEERSASAIAANQTMAMITRLQEEKAAMQMEALQYQRMMEEQSEYDQEALQLLNELMMKREKEKQELQKKVDVYRQKLRDYEIVERRKSAKGNRSGGSSSTEDSDDFSIESLDGDNSKHDVAVKHLVQFEEERLSILEQLKALEEKLFIPIENGHGIDGDCDLSRKSVNGGSGNGMAPNKLLPQFEVISLEDEDDDNYKKLALVKEVEHVYKRLQALEADRDFLKHCLSSLKKGDRGVDLLQEILQHLCDLRIMELQLSHNGV